jgi:hypothetical protein
MQRQKEQKLDDIKKQEQKLAQKLQRLSEMLFNLNNKDSESRRKMGSDSSS